MGIIGIVAALTIPNLNQSTGNKQNLTKFQKIYSDLSRAYMSAVAVYGPIETWFVNDTTEKQRNKRTADRMLEFMKISKNCTGSKVKGCFPNSFYKSLNGTAEDGLDDIYNLTNWDAPKYLTADGIAILFSDVKCHDRNFPDLPGVSSCGVIYVDIDGVDGPNTMGKDFFMFELTTNGIYGWGSKLTMYAKDKDGELILGCFLIGETCAGWITDIGNMEYLKADGEGVCIDSGVQFTWNQTTCN